MRVVLANHLSCSRRQSWVSSRAPYTRSHVGGVHLFNGHNNWFEHIRTTCLNRQLCLERADVQSDQGAAISYSGLSHELNIVTRQVILPRRYDPHFISASLDLTTEVWLPSLSPIKVRYPTLAGTSCSTTVPHLIQHLYNVDIDVQILNSTRCQKNVQANPHLFDRGFPDLLVRGDVEAVSFYLSLVE